MARRQVVLVAEQAESLDAVVNAVRERGLDVEDVFEELRMLFGSAQDEALESIRSVLGVLSIEEESSIQVPPPESDGPF